MKITNLLKRFKDQAQAFRVASIAGFFRDLAASKSKRRMKRTKSTKAKYKPGSIGASTVSQAIIKEYGTVLSRCERRKLKPFKAFYNK